MIEFFYISLITRGAKENVGLAKLFIESKTLLFKECESMRKGDCC